MRIISKLKEDSNSGEHKPKRRKISHVSSFLNQNLDMICKRFPHVSQRILKNLDDQSLIRSKEATRLIAKFLENEKFYWIRIIKKHDKNFEGFQESWKEVLGNSPVDIVKQLATATN